MKSVAFSFIFGAFVAAGSMYAATPGVQDQPNVEIIGAYHVLSRQDQGEITAMFEDDDGYLWLGISRNYSPPVLLIGKTDHQGARLYVHENPKIPFFAGYARQHDTVWTLSSRDDGHTLSQLDLHGNLLGQSFYAASYNEGANGLLYLGDATLLLLTTDAYRFVARRVDGQGQLVEQRLIDPAMQMLEYVTSYHDTVWVFGSTVIDQHGFLTMYTLTVSGELLSKMLFRDFPFETARALIVDDDTAIVVGHTWGTVLNAYSSSRSHLLKLSRDGAVRHSAPLMPPPEPVPADARDALAFTSQYSSKALDIVAFDGAYYVLLQRGIDSQGEVWLAKLDPLTFATIWREKLYDSTGRHQNGMMMTARGHLMVYGGQYIPTAKIPMRDYPMFLELKLR